MTVLYRRILGDVFDDLPPKLRALHGSAKPRRWSGQAEVRRGTGRVASVLGWIMRLPPPGDAVPVSVDFIPDNVGEVWMRDFGGKQFKSYQFMRSNSPLGVAQERFGMINVTVAFHSNGDRRALVPVSWSMIGVPLPKALLPTGESFETQVDDRFVFDVEITMPWIGRIAAYRGWLLPEGGAPADHLKTGLGKRRIRSFRQYPLGGGLMQA
ncbi:DUF4166 domain-containing protein [Tropicibacter sp. Alg240-R139]|uniref:DUF4166 domain-containing protein n=1 Tax=Tropicibacter sp. Alg240-R139 TaxID=2305991 RepID=UPI0013DE8F0D|nr:DUF4166 domain-containing protein [Tropicibacter sp. Alg240-R139]